MVRRARSGLLTILIGTDRTVGQFRGEDLPEILGQFSQSHFTLFSRENPLVSVFWKDLSSAK